jgi:uncharacterized HhH-GPD family protein
MGLKYMTDLVDLARSSGGNDALRDRPGLGQPILFPLCGRARTEEVGAASDPAFLPLDSEIERLIREAQEEEHRRSGDRPDAVSVIRKALRAMLASRLTDAQREAVVAALLTFGKAVAAGETLSKDPAANKLLMEDGFAFLLGVIFDQSIDSELAWAAPYKLKVRLGHLDPARIAANPQAVTRAITERPSLHRFVNHVSDYVVSAASRVMQQYGGRAEAIWEGSPAAEDLRERFDEFLGIAQKKAAMAVEILERVLRVPILRMDGSDVGYDVHIRRVFLRTGLALYDEPGHIIGVARQLNSDRPGAIDFPAWSVGKSWCYSGVPDCPACPLREPCPKLIDRAATVRGA